MKDFFQNLIVSILGIAGIIIMMAIGYFICVLVAWIILSILGAFGMNLDINAYQLGIIIYIVKLIF